MGIDKIKLKFLLKEYKDEFKNMNMVHLKDAIAIMLILEDSIISLLGIDITLTYPLNISFMNPKDDNYYKVPPLQVLEQSKKQYKKEIKYYESKVSNSLKYKLIATNWLILLLQCGFIKENQLIDTSKYKLNDFITDSRILEIVKNDNKNIQKKLISKRK